MPNAKFMQSLGPTVYHELQEIADRKNITIQELVRAVIIPDWLRTSGENLLPRVQANSQHPIHHDSGLLAPSLSHATHPPSPSTRLSSSKES